MLGAQHKRLRAATSARTQPASRRRLLLVEQPRPMRTRTTLRASSSTPSSNADRVLDATAPTSNLVDRYSSLLREFRRAKAELGGAPWLAQWRAEHGGARPTLADARAPGAPAALKSYVETRERLLAETPVLREEIGVGVLRVRVAETGDGSAGVTAAATTAARSARAQAALTMGVAADYRKRRASEQRAVEKVERVVAAEAGGGSGSAATTPAASRVRAAALAALRYKKGGGGGALSSGNGADANDDSNNAMPKPSAAVSVLASLLKEPPPKPLTGGKGEDGHEAVVVAVEAAKGDVAAAMAATPRGRDKRRVGAAEGAGLAQVVL